MKSVFNFFLLLLIHSFVFSQTADSLARKDSLPVALKDSLIVTSPKIKPKDSAALAHEALKRDSTGKRIHSPRQATIRSAIIPGWGQVYNGKFWKVPLVYGAIGFPAYLFVYNKQWYNRTRYALSLVAYNITDPESLAKVHPQLLPLVTAKKEGSLINYRNSFRKDMDYSVLFTLIMWGLNVVDATVDGHLRGFDVSDQLGLRIKPALIPGSYVPGISVALNFK